MSRLLLLLLVLIVAGCVPVYVPMRHNVPMHSGKNEFQGSVSVVQGLNIQTAYAITNHVGITGNYLYANNKRNESEEYRTQSAGEIGIGYFNNFNKNWCVEVYGGYGVGEATAFGNDYFLFAGDEFKITGNYQKVFIQPSYGFNGNELISNLSIKCSLIDFKELRFNIDGVDEDPSVKPKVFIAPVATIKFPIVTESLYGTLQVGLNMPAGGDPVFDYEPFMGSFGLTLKIKDKE